MNTVHMAAGRRERLKQELRAEILAAARDMFVHEGYAAVSMRKIAHRVGCAPGTLYLYFRDKDAILGAICLETFAKLDKYMEAIRNDKGDPLERLRRGGRQYIQFGLQHPDHYFLTFALGGATHKTDDHSRQAGSSSFDCLRDCVRMAVEAGRLRKTDVEEVAQSLWTMMHGTVMILIGKSEFPFIEQNRLIDSVLDIAIEGIRAK
jgi:AcrR family transcriptional regulator